MLRRWYSELDYFDQEKGTWLKLDNWAKLQTNREWERRTQDKGEQKEENEAEFLPRNTLFTNLQLIENSNYRKTTRCMKPTRLLSNEIPKDNTHKINLSEKPIKTCKEKSHQAEDIPKPIEILDDQMYQVKFKAKPVQENGNNSDEKTFKTEERIRYDKTHEFPQSVHGLVRVKHEGKTSTYGTGIMIGNNLVLTAAHNLWDKKEHKRYSIENIQFYPAVNGKKLPLGRANVKDFYLPDDFISTSSQEAPTDDYALLVLDRPLGEVTGYFGLDIADKSLIQSIKELFVVGYPGIVGDPEYQKLIIDGCYYQYGMKGKVFFDNENDPGFIHYDVVTSRGQSGSGVYYYNEKLNGYFVIGVHVLGRAGVDGYNSATWLTQKRFEQI